MSGEACPMPSRGRGRGRDADADAIGRMLGAGRIAIVGLSDDPSRVSYQIGSYLRAAGFTIVPVNPTHETVMGMKSYPRLQDVPGEIDLVNVFRRSEFCADVTRDAIEKGAKGVWLQSGVQNEEAKKLAGAAGIDFVQNRCIMVEHRTR